MWTLNLLLKLQISITSWCNTTLSCAEHWSEAHNSSDLLAATLGHSLSLLKRNAPICMSLATCLSGAEALNRIKLLYF